MAHAQAFYGRLSDLNPSKENIVVTTGDFTNGSNQFTIADPFFARVNQTLTYVDSQFTGTVTITNVAGSTITCLLYTSPSPRDGLLSRMPSSA